MNNPFPRKGGRSNLLLTRRPLQLWRAGEGEKREGVRFKWLVVLLFLLVSLILLLRPHPTPEQRFLIPKGASTHTIAHQLYERHFLWHPWTFLIWTKIYSPHKPFRAGAYLLSPSESGWTHFRKIEKGPQQARVTFPEGWTARQMASLLETRGVVAAAEFLEEANRNKREGFLFPDTYFFELGLPAAAVVERMVHRFHEKEPRDILAQARVWHLSYRQVVTLASLVEKEAQAPQERALIAGVFYNRLRKHWRLESCATVQYALGSWKPQLTYKDLQTNSPYNTYRHWGLPPGPICNPGAAALEAATHPAVTNMMFFVADGQGTHRFSRYYKEHLAVQNGNRQQATGNRDGRKE